MKKIKGVVCMILFAAGFLFNGELYIFYLDNFQNNYYYAAVSFQKVESDVTDGEIAEDFLKTAERYDVDFFMVNNKTREGISELMDYLQDDLPTLTLEQAKFKQSLGLNEWDSMPEGVEYPESIR